MYSPDVPINPTLNTPVMCISSKLLTPAEPRRAAARPPGKHMSQYVGPCTRAARGSCLDQVLSRLRDNSSWAPPLRALIAECASPCTPHRARLNVPSRLCKKRPRPCSPRLVSLWRVLFSFYYVFGPFFPNMTCIRIFWMHINNSQISRTSMSR